MYSSESQGNKGRLLIALFFFSARSFNLFMLFRHLIQKGRGFIFKNVAKFRSLVGKQCASGTAEALWKWHSEWVIICVARRKEEGSVLWFSRGCFVAAHWKCLLHSALLSSLRLWIHHLQLKCNLFRGRCVSSWMLRKGCVGADKFTQCHLAGSAVSLNRDNVGSNILFF